jgi:hypothetical protein
MEYLMTYGWAILIIAIVMVALFSLGILGGSPLGTTCLAQSGYTCQTPTLHATSFNVVIGQATGTTWATSNFIFVPSGYSNPVTQMCVAAASTSNTLASTSTGILCGVQIGNPSTSVVSGQAVPIYFTSAVTVSPGTSVSGQIWAIYTTATGGPFAAQVTSGVNLKAV